MARVFFAILSIVLAVPWSAHAVVLGLPEVARPVVQGQHFVSPNVSLITDGQTQGCMLSFGTNWKESAQARNASAVAAFTDGGATLNEAFAYTSPVSVQEFSSNTPFLAFVQSPEGARFARIAMGFAISYDIFAVGIEGSDQDISSFAEVEPRGDTLVIRDETAVAALFDAVISGREIGVSARSSKRIRTQEHHVRYRFKSPLPDPAHLDECMSLARAETPNLQALGDVSFTMAPTSGANASKRLELRGMSCNRDLDPNGAQLMRLAGAIAGLTTPLSHALVQFDDDGEVRHAWSGDLWRLSRTGSGYELSVSNSVLFQSPLAEQGLKACSRYARPRCATVEWIGQSIEIGPCFSGQLSAVGLPTGPLSSGPAQGLAAFGSPPSGGSIVAASSSGGTTTRTVIQRSVTTETVVNGPNTPPGQAPRQPSGETGLSSIPIPSSGLMMLFLLPLLLAAQLRIRRGH